MLKLQALSPKSAPAVGAKVVVWFNSAMKVNDALVGNYVDGVVESTTSSGWLRIRVPVRESVVTMTPKGDGYVGRGQDWYDIGNVFEATDDADTLAAMKKVNDAAIARTMREMAEAAEQAAKTKAYKEARAIEQAAREERARIEELETIEKALLANLDWTTRMTKVDEFDGKTFYFLRVTDARGNVDPVMFSVMCVTFVNYWDRKYSEVEGQLVVADPEPITRWTVAITAQDNRPGQTGMHGEPSQSSWSSYSGSSDMFESFEKAVEIGVIYRVWRY